ncbi:Uncharacterised protein [Mycobacteroides abscessus subsp. abscessus]|nr:Uncharacterised protein [Mycobacteroides abscessus subsp. abscessus]
MSPNTPVAKSIPAGDPNCVKLPNRPRRPTGACSTASRAAPPHSAPAASPCRTRSVASAAGASTPASE